ncbi:MAG: hypothetical protein Q7S96_00985 [bacterium]|nr:hypothetical protein [bacterium]
MAKKARRTTRTAADFVAYLRELQLDRKRAFANALATSNERFGVPLEIIAGSAHVATDAARWKQGRALPQNGDRVKIITRICEYLGHAAA